MALIIIFSPEISEHSTVALETEESSLLGQMVLVGCSFKSMYRPVLGQPFQNCHYDEIYCLGRISLSCNHFFSPLAVAIIKM